MGSTFYVLAAAMKILSTILLLLLSKGVAAQQQVINANGTSNRIGNLVFDHSIGEPMILSHELGATIITEGYLQPSYVTYHPIEKPLANNFITPNGDGRNDVLFFADLESYTQNGLKVFDRAGRLLYGASPYGNDWNGTFRGRKLEEDTYYYILERGNLSPLKGFVTIIHEVKGGIR